VDERLTNGSGMVGHSIATKLLDAGYSKVRLCTENMNSINEMERNELSLLNFRGIEKKCLRLHGRISNPSSLPFRTKKIGARKRESSIMSNKHNEASNRKYLKLNLM
jgi:hypothetical protein